MNEGEANIDVNAGYYFVDDDQPGVLQHYLPGMFPGHNVSVWYEREKQWDEPSI
jgi:hypothetical protein